MAEEPEMMRTGSGQDVGTRLAYILARVQKKVNQGSGPRGSEKYGDSLGAGDSCYCGWFIRLEALFAQCSQCRGE